MAGLLQRNPLIRLCTGEDCMTTFVVVGAVMDRRRAGSTKRLMGGHDAAVLLLWLVFMFAVRYVRLAWAEYVT